MEQRATLNVVFGKLRFGFCQCADCKSFKKVTTSVESQALYKITYEHFRLEIQGFSHANEFISDYRTTDHL